MEETIRRAFDRRRLVPRNRLRVARGAGREKDIDRIAGRTFDGVELVVGVEEISPGEVVRTQPDRQRVAGGDSAARTFSYMGSVLPARWITSWVKMALAAPNRTRVAISLGMKLSAIETMTPPSLIAPR
jgi:hypothetical protein